MATAPRLRLLALGARAATVRSTDSVPARGAPALRASFGSSSRSSSATAPRAAPTAPTTPPRPQATTTATAISRGVRWSSESAAGNKIWTFDEISALTTTTPSPAEPKVTLIDVREPSELASTGRIPGALNVPISSAPDSFHVADDEFEERYGFARPAADEEVVFYCKAGVRSRAAASIARDAGWRRIGEYTGSWVDWVGKGGKVER